MSGRPLVVNTERLGSRPYDDQITKTKRSLFEAYQRSPAITIDLDPRPFADVELPTIVVGAQNFLDSACASVENALSAALRQRAVRLAYENKDPRGNYSQADQDLLRAALPFAGAGVDAVMKRLLRDSLSTLVGISESADRLLVTFAEEHIAPRSGPVDRSALATLFLSDRPRDALVVSYIDHLTSGSLQSADRVQSVAKTLGVEDRRFYKRIDPKKSLLRDGFLARNEIVHQLDLREPGLLERGARGHRRETRKLGDVEGWSREALSVCQYVVNHVARLAGHS